jgi:predicted RNA-binding Zn ribbon-like protein
LVVSGRPRYQRIVDGLVLPVPVASHPALDFCNTLAGWSSTTPRDYLASYAHLVVWTREAGLVDPEAARRLHHSAELDPAGAARTLKRAHSLRGALYGACTDSANHAAWEAVARETRAAGAHVVLRSDAPPGRRLAISDATGLALPVLELARCAGELLSTLDLAHVKACPGTDCGWLFVDPRGRRRWCSMGVCGNRAKARRHARRVREAAADRGRA